MFESKYGAIILYHTHYLYLIYLTIELHLYNLNGNLVRVLTRMAFKIFTGSGS